LGVRGQETPAALSDLRSKIGHSTHARPIQEGKLKAQADWEWATAAVLSGLRSKTGHSTHAKPIQEDKPKAQADWEWATAAVLSDLRSKTGHSTHARPIQEDKPKAQADWQWATADAALLRSAQCVTAQRALHQHLKMQSSLHFLYGAYAATSPWCYPVPGHPTRDGIFNPQSISMNSE